VKNGLERIEVPDEHDARERAWAVVQAAFASRQPVERSSHRLRPALALAAVLAVVAAALSPPGRAVIDEIREVVGVERAQPALFSLPSSGKLLVASDAGIWVIHEDGSRRLLGEYREASWSPFGRFVVAVRENELAALEPDGDVRWTLPRRDVASPRWAGTETDTRIAYFDSSGIRVVAGDGTGDRLLVPGGRGRLAWRPGAGLVLAYASAREVRVLDVDNSRTLWRAQRRPAASVTTVEWSSDGQRLLVLSPQALKVYDARGRVVDRNDPAEGWPDVDAAFQPGTNRVAIARVHGSQSTVFGWRTLFNGFGEFREIAWSPDGRWLLVSWPTADQWVFVRAEGGRRIRAVASISGQFRSQSFPRVEGWCCAR
jgi:dipeptidyl aminopeptidase/acylaminoacyl peptidase